MLQTSWPPNGIRYKADAVKPQILKPRPKLSVPMTSSKAFAFKTKVTFHNMPRSKACKRLFCYVVKYVNMHLPETTLD